jgi:hypothetical protein
MATVGRVGRCQGGAGCASQFCWLHGERNKMLFGDWGAYTTQERERLLAAAPPSSGHLGFVPLAPRRRRQLGAVVSVAAGAGMVLLAVLVALGVVHLIGILGGR